MPRAGWVSLAVVRYQPISAGGRIPHSTRDPSLVAAIHAWFGAQVADHGAHAERRF